ncbi:MAG: tyrosine-protein phosphatase [Pseudomonadota bacterium]
MTQPGPSGSDPRAVLEAEGAWRMARDSAPWDGARLSLRQRLGAWTSMLLLDHGVLRLFYLNRHRLGPQAWRSAQPMPHQIRWFARQGVASVLSLRGGMRVAALPLEREACADLGLGFRKVTVKSRGLLGRVELLALIATMRAMPKPVLYHCKSGADRAGFVAVLHRHLIDGVPIAEAQRALSSRYGHFRRSRTGILDHFFDAYAAAARQTGVTLEDWIATDYDPVALMAEFRPRGAIAWIVDRVLRRE